MAVELRNALEKEVAQYQAIQRDIQKALNIRQQLVSQSSENDMVLDELKRLDDSANVYKLIGPALIKQDLVEATSNVSKRIEYIKGELDRVDNQIKGLESRAKERAAEVEKLQRRLQSQAT